MTKISFITKNRILALCAAFALLAPICVFAQELTFWNFWSPSLISPIIEKFEKENPGIKIHSEQLSFASGLDKIVAALANDQAPDICELGSTWMGKFMSEGVLADTTEYFNDLKPYYLMFEPAALNGRLYGMPWLAGTRVLFYNKDLFKAASLNPNKPPTTWAELYNAVKAIHNPEKGVYGFGMNAGEGHILYKKFMPFVWGNNGKIFDKNGKFVFDSEQTRQALNFYLSLKEFSYCEKQDLLDEAFMRNRLGIMVSGSWNLARFPTDAPQLNFGVALMPKPAANKGFSASFLGGEILAVFKTCKHIPEAARFLRFITRPENSLAIAKVAMTSFPAHKDAYKDSFFTKNKRLSVFVEQMKTAVHPPVHPLWIELERVINNLTEKAMYGKNINELFIEANNEYARLSAESLKLRQKNIDSAPLSKAGVSFNGSAPKSGSAELVLLSVIAAITLLNAILLVFLIYEVKKNAA